MADFSKLSKSEFAKIYSQILDKIIEDPIENFVKARGFMDFIPSPTQEVILKVIFNKELDYKNKRVVQIEIPLEDGGIKIIPVEMTEVELYEYLTESEYDFSDIRKNKIKNVDLICGRRSGKTTISAIIAIYCAITTNWKPYLKKTPTATVLILSHSKEFSDEVLDIIRQFIEESPVLTNLINKKRKQTTSAMNLSVPFIEGNKIVNSNVQIKVGAASKKTTRGVAACAVLCDEIAYWNLDESMKETDIKILQAVRPAMKQFGDKAMMIKLSSPGIRQGVLYNEYEASRKGTLPKSYAVFKAPTWMMNSIIPVSELKEEYTYDPEGFDVEYRANFADSLSNFISPEFLDKAVMENIEFLQASGNKSVQYYAAIDAAYKSDKFTFTVVGVSENRITQCISKGWEGTKKNPVKAHDVAQWIKTNIKDYGVNVIYADQFSFQPLKEIFDQYGLNLEENTFSPTFKKKIYFNLKKLVHSEQIDLLDNKIQTKELRELIVEKSSSGTIKIGHPNSGSDDFADSLAVAAFRAVEQKGAGKFTFQALESVKSYEIKTDSLGRSIKAAPSAEMLVNSGHFPENIIDNSASYQRNPLTGLLERVDEDPDGSDDGPQFSFG